MASPEKKGYEFTVVETIEIRPGSVLIVVPVFNEQENIARVLGEIQSTAPDYTLCLVNDCSTDETLRVLREVAEKRKNLVVLSHAVNQGYGVSIQTGYKYAALHGYEYVIQLDADGQHNPADIPRFVERMRVDFPDVILGSRFGGHAPPAAVSGLKMAAVKMFRFMLRARHGVKISDPTTGFQMLSRRAIQLFCQDFFPSDYPDANLIGLGLSSKLRYAEIAVTMREREHGTSMHSGLLKKAYYMYKVTFLTLLSMLPTRWSKAHAR